jgi:nicotinate dehydrogenase subunit B
MTAERETSKDEHLSRKDLLAVLSPAMDGEGELYLTIGPDGLITAFNGHVDLGTGIRTSLAQIVAEELCVPFEHVQMVLGATSVAPNQGATIASETIQVTVTPLRLAAATARCFLLAKAAQLHRIPVESLIVEEGIIRTATLENWSMTFADLVAGDYVRLTIDPEAPLKPVSDYRIVGASQRRVDIPQKATGRWTYVHDVRVPGMLHGRVVRPPYAGFDHGEHVGTSLISIDESSVADVAGLVAVVAIGDFVGVVATREENAALAAKQLKVLWRAAPDRPDLNAPEEALRANPSTPRKLADRGNVDLALAGATTAMDRTYVWPYQMHASIGPSCAVADFLENQLTVWSGTQNPFPMRRDLSILLDLPEDCITVERLEAAGCYGRNCADDVTADAALLSRAVNAPVRVQLTREQEHAWEPKGAAQVIDVRGGLDVDGGPSAYDFETRYPSNLAPTLPLILTGKIPAAPDTLQMGDRTAIPPYAYGNLRVTVHDMPPIARASWFRGVSAMPNTFAHESYVDELATAAGVDPIEYRLRYLQDPRAIDLVHAVAERANWVPHIKPGTLGGEGDLLYGRGFAYAVYVHGKFPGTAAAWAAWVTDVAVNRKTGEIAVTKVICAQDSGLMINPDGVRHQIHGNIIQSTSRVLKEKVDFSSTAVTSKEWGGYSLITFPDVPDIDVLMIPRPDEPPLGVGESASVPSAAAIANAVFDATGIRFRELPLTPERVLAGLNGGGQAEAPVQRKRFTWWKFGLPLAGGLAAVTGLLTMGSPWRPAIGPIERPDANVYSSVTIERGRLVAAAGACNVCHVGTDGVAFAGGRRFDTPFGAVYATNITPDVKNGIGGWSYPAFERAMRQGVSRDGHHLYPAHPYTSFAGAEDADLQALYAYMMTQTPVAEKPAETKLKFPFSIRALMAGWNAMFLKAAPFQYNKAEDAEWNRGAYLVETLGHCSACHTERNVLGAEKGGKAFLSGGFADGWEAPALNGQAKSPISWTKDAFYDYLRSGHARDHGSAAGPMADVVSALAPLPDADIRAMAAYLARGSATAAEKRSATAETVVAASVAAEADAARLAPKGARIFEGACASCHTGTNALSSLALNSNLHSDHPDNLLQVILNGVEAPAILAQTTGRETPEIMSMPAFSNTLDEQQIANLAAYLRARFAPGKTAWDGIGDATRRVGSVVH